MAILWCGGEEIDFPTRAPNLTSNTFAVGTRFRGAPYSRNCLYAPTGAADIASNIFEAGAITSGWLSFYNYAGVISALNTRLLGLGKNNGGAGIFVGQGSTASKVALIKWDGVTSTKLAEADCPWATTLTKIDLRVDDFGASGRARIYLNAAVNPVIDYTGNLVAGGITDLNQVVGYYTGNGSQFHCPSEFIAATEDTRLFSLMTLTPNAAGDTLQWTGGTYTAIDEELLNDGDAISSAVAEQDATFNLTNTAAGANLLCKAVRVVARATDGVGGMGLQIGVKTNGAMHLGGTITLPSVWGTVEKMFQNNPATANRFTLAELDALQIAFRSKAV